MAELGDTAFVRVVRAHPFGWITSGLAVHRGCQHLSPSDQRTQSISPRRKSADPRSIDLSTTRVYLVYSAVQNPDSVVPGCSRICFARTAESLAFFAISSHCDMLTKQTHPPGYVAQSLANSSPFVGFGRNPQPLPVYFSLDFSLRAKRPPPPSDLGIVPSLGNVSKFKLQLPTQINAVSL